MMDKVISDIKKELRAAMNGIASKAMRDAGMTADYRVNFGVDLPRLQLLAEDISANMLLEGDDREEQRARLAQRLWKESVRECRILATMLYPTERMDMELADVWAETVRTVEIAQIAALHLFSKIPDASSLAFRWMAADDEMRQILGFYTVFHVVRNRMLSERSKDELRDQAETALISKSPQLKAVAGKVLMLLDA